MPALLLGLTLGLAAVVVERAGASRADEFALIPAAVIAFAVVGGRTGLLDRHQSLGGYTVVLLAAATAALALTFAAGVNGALTGTALFVIAAACQLDAYRRVQASHH